jgi:hypothetical protein
MLPPFGSAMTPPTQVRRDVLETAGFPVDAVHGARFSTEIYTRGWHWFPHLCSARSKHACDQWRSTRVSTFLTGSHCTLRPNTEGTSCSLF